VTKILEFIRLLWTQGACNILEVGPICIFRWSGSEPAKNSSATPLPVVSEDGGKLSSETL